MEPERLLWRGHSEGGGEPPSLQGMPAWKAIKSREREGSALAVRSLLPYDSAGVLVRQLRGPHLSI